MRSNRNRHILSLLIVSLLLMQSVALKADLHQFHQTQTQINLTEHGLSEHEHEHMQISQVDDCQHCCHCHGGSHFYLVSTSPNLTASESVDTQHDAAVPLFHSAHIPAIRPPIA